jgi:hypothetical protein
LVVTPKHKSLADGVSDFRNSRPAIKAREGHVCFGSGKQKIFEVFHHVDESSLISQGSGPRWNRPLSVMWKPRKAMQRELSGAENLKFHLPLQLAPHVDIVVSLVIHPT